MFNYIHRFASARSGAASIEFALLGTVMLLLLAGGGDLVQMVSAKRDADRASVLIAHAMATCVNTSCMSDFINLYAPREANALLRHPKAMLNLYMIQRQKGQIKSCSGTQQILTDADIIVSAKNLMQDNDVGAVAVISLTYVSIFPNFVKNYISSSGANFRRYAIDILGNVGAAC